MKDIVFFTIADDKYYYPVGTHILVNSFKRFHPNIDLVVFRQDTIDKVFNEKDINFYQAKPTFAKLLVDKYKTVVNIDADTIILDRLTEIVDNDDWEVGGVWNFNDYEVASMPGIGSEMYVQAGLVGARNKRFWDIWEEANKDAMRYMRQENDILNLIWYQHDEVRPMNKVIWDIDKNYLGCKSLGREGEFEMKGKKVMCRGEQVKAYHNAKGAKFPKLDLENMGFSREVTEYMKYCAYKGVTEVYGRI